jgi:uncharacterized protein DUF4136
MKPFVLTVTVSLMSVLVSIAVTAAAGYTPKYRVKVQADKHTDFSKLRTYSWMDSHPASIPAVDAQIVRAIEGELAALGLTKVPSGTGDVVATYTSMTRTDVNTKSKPIAKDYRAEYSVATLVVSLLEPETLKPLLQLRVDWPIASAAIDPSAAAVEQLFRFFPARQH